MRAVLVSLLLLGCGAEADVAETRMSLGGNVGDVKSVVVLVLGGPRASCPHVLEPVSPLADPELEILRHALFTLDGTAKHLSIPAGRKLAIYAEAYRSSDGSGPRAGRGCAEADLEAGRSSGVSITINAED